MANDTINTYRIFWLNHFQKTQKLSDVIYADLADVTVEPFVQDELDHWSSRSATLDFDVAGTQTCELVP
jgi:hypothetical protein